eukprot:TRINITY_DN15939_c0_g1_i1.p1 TRINITY_DN15939_c0_g1~~TRINITY_DN15939_c0_g1_i1.p1  ORF type:complete len:260 (-),score=71.93 TRINITY_DN15939_c0_g1_i1:109-888(-)
MQMDRPYDFVVFDWKGTLETKLGMKAATTTSSPDPEWEEVGLDTMLDVLEADEEMKTVIRKLFTHHFKMGKEIQHSTSQVCSKTETLQKILEDAEIAEAKRQTAIDAFYSKYNSSSKRKKAMYDGAAKLLQRLKDEGIPIALLRNSTLPGEVFNKTILQCEAHHYFDVEKNVVLSGDIGFAKPDRKLFEALLEKCQMSHVHPHKILFVGNETAYDIKGGNNMGWKTVLIRTTESTSNGLATFEIDHHDELHSILFPTVC